MLIVRPRSAMHVVNVTIRFCNFTTVNVPCTSNGTRMEKCWSSFLKDVTVALGNACAQLHLVRKWSIIILVLCTWDKPMQMVTF